MKKLGMIGGTSWHSTVVYYKLINEKVVKSTDENPELLIHSIDMGIMREGDIDKIQNKYLEVSRELADDGVDAILICANTPHLVYPFVQPKIGVPILHIAEAIGRRAKKLGLKKLGLLGTKPTMLKDFITAPLKENFGIETIIPDEQHIEQTHEYISKELTKGVFSHEAKSYYLERMQELKNRGADGIILGCTELPMLIEQSDFDLPLLDTTDLHAQMAAEFILG